MFQSFKKILCFLFCILLCTQVFAAPDNGIKKVVDQFIIDEGLDSSNFAMGYYNPVSGESYLFNADTFLPVDRLRFLPTNMYFYEEETKGSFEPDTPETPPYTIGEMSLEDCRYHSIILGEEGVSLKMQAEVGTAMQYLELVNQRYGKLDPGSLPEMYWEGNTMSIRFLMNCVCTVSSRPEHFNGLMSNYSMVQKANAFVSSSVTYPIVQIRDEADGYITAVAEVSAPQNFLIVASVKNTALGDAILGRLNKAICDYIISNTEEDPVTGEPKATASHSNPSYYVGEERLNKDNTLTRWLVLSFSIAAGLTAICLSVCFIWRSRHRRY